MPKAQIVLENVPKDDMSFLKLLPANHGHFRRIKSDHPTPFIFVEFEDDDACTNAIEYFNNGQEVFRAKIWEDRASKKFVSLSFVC